MADNKLIQIRASWATRRDCCFCFNICFVHSCSDGHFRCGACAEKLITDGKAYWADSFPDVPLDHLHEWGLRQDIKQMIRDKDFSFIKPICLLET